MKIIVVGGGPAGVTAALRARELGAEVTLIERGAMGGVCTNTGCVPVRVLAKAARLHRDSGQFARYGLDGSPPTLDFADLMEKTRRIVAEVHDKKQLAEGMRRAGVAVRAGVGDAAFLDAHTLRLADGETLTADRFILCPGGKPRRLPFPGADLALTPVNLWDLRELPPSLVIVGASATGCQLASVMANFGSQVTLLETATRILGTEDADVAAALHDALTARGVRLETGIKEITRIDAAEGHARPTRRVTFAKSDGAEEVIECAEAILSVGWPGNVESLNLDAAGVERDKDYIKVSDRLQTSAAHIYAAGDVTGRMMLVQSAYHEARVAAENAVCGEGGDSHHALVPHGGFTDPEYGAVGATEEKLKESGVPYLSVSIPYADLDRAFIDNRPDGFLKLLADENTHEVLGVHAVGEQALEVVQAAAVGMAAGVTLEQLAELEIAYPTFTAILGLAARALCRECGAIRQENADGILAHPAASEWERKLERVQ